MPSCNIDCQNAILEDRISTEWEGKKYLLGATRKCRTADCADPISEKVIEFVAEVQGCEQLTEVVMQQCSNWELNM